ncbi:MAG: hypothetical protein ACKVQC_02485 [Elusimicrobiota bacterium]
MAVKFRVFGVILIALGCFMVSNGAASETRQMQVKAQFPKSVNLEKYYLNKEWQWDVLKMKLDELTEQGYKYAIQVSPLFESNTIMFTAHLTDPDIEIKVSENKIFHPMLNTDTDLEESRLVTPVNAVILVGKDNMQCSGVGRVTIKSPNKIMMVCEEKVNLK